MSSGPLAFEVGEEEAGERIDAALAELSEVSRSQLRRWIDAGRVTVDGRPVRASHRLAAGERVEAHPPEPLPPPLEAEAIPLAVLFEDAHLVVIDKPAGLVVHPAPGHRSGTLVNALLHHCGRLATVGGVLRPGIVHRLDQGTSGVMVVAKTDVAHHGLAAQFHEHTIERVYRALVRGLPGADTGRVERPIGRHPRDRKRMSVHTRSGREARTAWRVERRFARSRCSLLEVRPETGRTHQIRVHLASVGLPLLGDPVYGRARRGAAARGLPALGRPALHAAALGFTHPATGQWLRFSTPLPPDLAAVVEALERAEAAGGSAR
jgi:23S rRNA pseudouridine1911/1915/1917 synthase